MPEITEKLNKTTENLLLLKKFLHSPLEFEVVSGNRTVVPSGNTTHWRTMPFHLCVVGEIPQGNGCRVLFKDRPGITLAGPKTLIFIPSGVTHCIEDLGPDSRISNWIHFYLHCLNVFDAFTELRTAPFAMPLPDNGIERLLKEILRETDPVDLSKSIRYQMCGVSLCLKLLELASPDEKIGAVPSLRKQRLLPALELLNGTGEKPSVAMLAASVNLSPSRFLNLFAREMGISAGQYYKRNLFGRACRLLADPGKNMAECAEELGFADACHFSREFRRYSGITPSCYRKDLFTRMK